MTGRGAGHLLPLLVEKGCIAVDGISLTVAAVIDDGFTVSLIPHTLLTPSPAAWAAGTG